MAFDWTPERVSELKRHYFAGLSARQIAEAMGDGLTRNAVIGKTTRLGLTTPKPKASGRLKQAAMVSGGFHRTCQWPFGDPGEPDFHFCGEKAETGRPYCEKHCARAYRTASDKDEDVAA